MSFIGSGELEHKITQLQRQLSHKDHELNSIKNEQLKGKEDLEEAKRAKETAEYKLRDEADRALKAENSLISKNNELGQLKLKLSNMEASLTSTTDKLKKEEKEKDRVQDALDEALSRGTDDAADQIKGQQARIKQLEDNIKKSEQEIEGLRAQGSSGESDEPLNHRERIRLMSLQNENAELKAQLQNMPSSAPSSSQVSIPYSPAKQKSRRSLSVSASEIRALEGQVESLKTQLASTKRDYDKAVNEKLAVESSAKKSIVKLEEDLEELRGEVAYYRASEGGADAKQMEELKKAAQRVREEKEDLAKKLADKEIEVQRQLEQITQLESEALVVVTLRGELQNERQAREKLEAANVSQASVADDSSLDKINALESELAKFRAATSTTSRSGDSELRQVRRDLQKALRDRDYLDTLVKENDELLAEKDEELSRMRAAIPIPGSPIIGAQDDSSRVAELEEEKAGLLLDLEKQVQDHAREIVAIEDKLSAIMSELDQVKAQETEARTRCEEGKTEIAELQSNRQEVLVALEQARTSLSKKEIELQALTQRFTESQSVLSERQTALASTEQEVQETLSRLSDAQTALASKQNDFDQVARQRDDLQVVLASRSHDDTEHDTLRVSLQQAQDALEEVTQGLEQAEAESKDLSARVIASQEAQTAAEARRQETERELAAYEHDHESLKAKLVELNDEIASLQDQLQATASQLEDSESVSRKTVSELEQASEKNHELEARISQLDLQLQETSRATILSGAKVDENKAKLESSLVAAEARVSELSQRVSELQSSLHTATQSPPRDTASLAQTKEIEEKIGRLRNERDDLRHNISFVQNERHFAVRAANFERDEAAKKVQRVEEEIRRKNATCEKLREEINGLRVREQEMQAELEGVSSSFASDKQQLDERIVGLESSLAAAHKDVAALSTQVIELESNLQTSEDALKHAETKAESLQTELTNVLHHVAQSRKLSDRPDSRASSTVVGEDGDLPGDLASAVPTETRRLSHQRSRSGLLQNVQIERDLRAKIERRDARIAGLTNDLNKAKSNLALLESAQEDTIAENAELEGECSMLQKRLATEARDSIEGTRGLVLALAAYRQHLHGTDTRWSVAQDALSRSRKTILRLRTTGATDGKVASEQEARIVALEAASTMANTDLAAARAEQESARAELRIVQETNSRLQVRLAQSEKAGVVAAESAKTLAMLESRVSEREERIHELSAQNNDLTAKLEAMEKAEQESTAQIAEKEEKINALAEKIEQLSLDLARAQTAASAIGLEKDQLLEELAEAEKTSSEGLADVEAQKLTAQSSLSKVEDELVKATQQLTQKTEELDLAIANSQTLSAELNAERSRSAENSVNIDQQRSVVDQLRAEIALAQEAVKTLEAERDALQAQMSELQSQVSEAERTAQDAVQAEERRVEEIESARRNIKELTELLERAVAEKEEMVRQTESGNQVREANEQKLIERDSEITRLSSELHVNEDKLISVRGHTDEALRRTEALAADVASLRDENEKLKLDLTRAMAAPSAPVIDEQLVIELKERVNDLEAALTQKNKEVDEADDQTREAFKAKAKLERKIGKLTRQLEQAQTDVNTAMNKLLSSKPIGPSPVKRATAPDPVSSRTSMPPPPISVQAAPIPPTSVSRTPRAIPSNIFSPPTAPGSGHKRSRENDDVEAIRPAEAIMLPASSNTISPRKALGSKSGFTPQRGGAFAPLSARLGVNGNVAAEKPVVVGEIKKSMDMGRNIFAKPSPATAEPAKRSAFPLPPTRTPFSTTPRNTS